MQTKITTHDGEGNRMFINIRLDDQCNNGHQDFAITANIYEGNKPTTDRNMIAAGCCHSKILAARPELGIFVDLHLSDYSGVPMHAVENGFYHLSRMPKDEFCTYYRVTSDQYDALVTCESREHYATAILSLGILNQWKAQADHAIKVLEEMTGETFVNTSVTSNFHTV